MVEGLIIFLGILAIYAVINIRQGGFNTKQLVLLALLIALASAGRVAFDYTLHIHALKPTSFIIMVSGMVLGGGAGFIVGSMTGFVSNIFIGLGPYTPWQMALWGFMGLFAYLLKGQKRGVKAVYGFAWGFIFGWIMNIPYYAMGIVQFSWGAYLASCTASFYFDLMHGLVNATMLLLFSDEWLNRIISATRLELKRS